MKCFIGGALCFLLLLVPITTAHAELIRGQVLLPDGTPAVKAEIWHEGYGKAAMPANMPIKLDAEGRFQLDIPSDSDVPGYFGRVTIAYPGHAPSGGALRMDENIFRLQPVLPLQGRVVDEKGQPVAGVKIALKSLSEIGGQMGRRHISVQRSPLAERLTAVSDANGQWRIDAGAAGFRASVEVQDSRFQRLNSTVLAGQDSVIKLRAGASLAGRVMYANGTPAAKSWVSVRAQGYPDSAVTWSEAQSDDNGRFSFNSLSETAYSVTVDISNGDWVAVPLKNVVPKVGETQALPDMVLVKGAVIQGIITDDKGAPVAKAYVGPPEEDWYVREGGIYQGLSGEDGRFRLRVPPGKTNIRILSQPREYLMSGLSSAQYAQTVEVAEGDTRELSFTLERGQSLKGTVKDRAGMPVGNISLTLERIAPMPQYTVYALSKAKGVWEAVGMMPGKWRILTEGEWEVTSADEVEVPSTKDFELRVQPVEYHAVRGRVVSFTGQPVTGASLKFSLTVMKGESFSSMTERLVVSDAKGEYEIDKLRRGVKVELLAAEKPGFQFSKGGLSQKRGEYNFTDVVMVARHARLAGTVVDAQGQPVGNARVISPDAMAQSIAITDAQGKFQIENLAQGMIDIIVTHPEKGVAMDRYISDGADIKLQLKPASAEPARDLEQAIAILQEDSGTGIDAITILPSNFDRAVQLATKADGTLHASFVARAIVFLAKREPEKALAWGLPLVDEIQDVRTQGYIVARLGLGVADINPQVTRELYDKLSAMAPEPGDAARVHLLYKAVLAAKLKLPEASALVDEALAAEDVDADRGYGIMVAEALARADMDQAKRVLGKLQGNEKANALRSVAEVIIQEGKLEELPGFMPILDAAENSGDEASFGFSMTALHVIPILGRTDPAAALKLAQRVQYRHFKPRALTLAALSQEKKVMRGLLQEAAALALGHQAPVAELAQVAIYTSPHFPELAREMTERALAVYQKSSEETIKLYSGREKDVQNVAIALSLYDKVAARELLEVAWIKLQRQSGQEGRKGYDEQKIALAMANVDFERALQMARSITEEVSGMSYRRLTLRQLAQWMLASPEKRHLLWLENNNLLEPSGPTNF